ncbi:MAG: EF-hand domain-containing protein [Steroidobacterales bacterium]
MSTIRLIRRAVAMAACAVALGYGSGALADDMASFGTGAYASGVRTMELMHKIDTDGDGTVSREEWNAFQEKVFAMLDKNKNGNVDSKEFMSRGNEMAGFATGGYAKGLQTMEMMHKIDADGDGMVTRDEFIAYQTKVFDLMDTSTSHKGKLGADEFATGGASRH